MPNKEEIFAKLREFLTKPTNELTKSHYRVFFGAVRESRTWLKLKKLTKEELGVSEEANQLLTDWITNYDSKRGISAKALTDLSVEYGELLNSCDEVLVEPNPAPKSTPIFDKLTERLKQAEEGFQWLEWWNKNELIIKAGGVLIIILLAWLVWRAVWEEVSK